MGEYWIKFVIKIDGIQIKVDAKVVTQPYRSYHMQCVGCFVFNEVDSGAFIGLANRYHQDCYETLLLADTEEQISLAYSALEWLQKHDSGNYNQMSWNTAKTGRAEDYSNHEQSDGNNEQEQQQISVQSLDENKAE